MIRRLLWLIFYIVSYVLYFGMAWTVYFVFAVAVICQWVISGKYDMIEKVDKWDRYCKERIEAFAKRIYDND